MMPYGKILLATLLVAFFSTPVQAKDLFSVTATAGGTTQTVSFNSFTDAFDQLDRDTSDMQNLIDAYDAGQAVSAVLDMRGLTVNLSMATGSNTLVFHVPSLGIHKTFTGADRDASIEELKDFLLENGDSIMTDLLQELVSSTPIDPVAGNPNSLMAIMGTRDFAMGTQDLGGDFTGSSFTIGGLGPDKLVADMAGGVGMTTEPSGRVSDKNSFVIGAGAGTYSVADDYSQTIYTFPIKYITRFDANPDYRLTVELPVTIVDTDSSMAYHTSFALGLRVPLFKDRQWNWSVTPAVRAGAIGSVDMGAAAILYSGSATSHLQYKFDSVTLAMGNMVSFITTAPLEYGDYQINYDLTNQRFRNGLSADIPVGSVSETPLSVQLGAAHNLFTGDKLYIDNYVDTFISFGTSPTSESWNTVRLQAGYTFADNFDGYNAKLQFAF